MLEREGVTSVKIVVRVRRNEVLVRKMELDERGMVVAKYGLAVTGEWLRVPEGEAYPDECRLAVSWLDWMAQSGRQVKFWVVDGTWRLRAWRGRCVAALRFWRRRCKWYARHWRFALKGWARGKR